jgi:transposase-like protein
MAEGRISLPELMDKLLSEGDRDLLAEMLTRALQGLMDADVTRQIGAARYERSEERAARRNGYRDREFDTRLGTLLLRIPKLREGTYFPPFLEPRRRSERAIVSVVLEAYVHGVSTRHVDDLVQAMGMAGISKSEVSRMVSELDGMVEAFRSRPLTLRYPYIWIDAIYEKVRENNRVVSEALLVAVGVNEEGQREVLGFAVGPAEDEESWKGFLRSLVARGMTGVQLVISDAHQGIQKAVRAVLHGASWQRCKVHFLRNVASKVSRGAQGMVLAAVKNIFVQPTPKDAQETLRKTADMLEEKFPAVSKMLLEAESDVLAYMEFPEEHRRQISSTNPLERENKELRRRTRVVEIFPNQASLLRLSGALLAEHHDEWLVTRRYMSQQSLAVLYTPRGLLEEVKAG